MTVRGRLTTGTAPASVPGGQVHYVAYLPAGYEKPANRLVRYPTVYLLHGRGDTHLAWMHAVPVLDELIASGAIPPVICVMPDAPWSARAGFYVDSRHTDGAAVESAFTADLLPHIDSRLRTVAHRERRVVAGYSMGGAGAVRFALAHSTLFGAAIALSPAVYVPTPPAGSSARESGAFGVCAVTFDAARYRELAYPSALDAFDPSLSIRLFIAVGDAEFRHPPADAAHDLDYEAATLYNRAKRVQGITASLRVYGGGHDWTVWNRGLGEGLTVVAGDWLELAAHAVP